MRALDRTAMGAKYAGKWVALKGDRKTVVASGTSVRKVVDAARKNEIESPVITRMPREIRSFVHSYRRTVV